MTCTRFHRRKSLAFKNPSFRLLQCLVGETRDYGQSAIRFELSYFFRQLLSFPEGFVAGRAPLVGFCLYDSLRTFDQRRSLCPRRHGCYRDAEKSRSKSLGNKPSTPPKETMKIRLLLTLVGLAIIFALPTFAKQRAQPCFWSSFETP